VETATTAVAESFFSTLKMELVYRTGWSTRLEARIDVHEYIEVFYNRSVGTRPWVPHTGGVRACFTEHATRLSQGAGALPRAPLRAYPGGLAQRYLVGQLPQARDHTSAPRTSTSSSVWPSATRLPKPIERCRTNSRRLASNRESRASGGYVPSTACRSSSSSYARPTRPRPGASS
jgi:hypothetical protein